MMESLLAVIVDASDAGKTTGKFFWVVVAVAGLVSVNNALKKEDHNKKCYIALGLAWGLVLLSQLALITRPIFPSALVWGLLFGGAVLIVVAVAGYMVHCDIDVFLWIDDCWCCSCA